MVIEELSQGEFLSKGIESPKVWRSELVESGVSKPIIEFEAWVTTESLDRDGEIIRVNGWRKPSLGRCKLLLFHDYDELPIGKPYWTKPKTEGERIGLYTRGRLGPQIQGLACGELLLLGDMDSFSVGFNWFKRTFDAEADGIKKPFFEYLDQELYEYSLVNIPSNPEATIAMQRMIADAGDVKDAMAIIKGFKATPKQIINRDSYKIKDKEIYDILFDIKARLDCIENIKRTEPYVVDIIDSQDYDDGIVIDDDDIDLDVEVEVDALRDVGDISDSSDIIVEISDGTGDGASIVVEL